MKPSIGGVVRVLLVFLMGVFAGFLLSSNTGFMADPKIAIEPGNGPFTLNDGAKNEFLEVYYIIKPTEHAVVKTRLVFNKSTGGMKTWETPSEGQDFQKRIVDLDQDGRKEVVLLCPHPRVVFISDTFDFVTRPIDYLDSDASFTLIEGSDGEPTIRQNPDLDKGGTPSYFKWSRDQGFHSLEH